MYELVYLIAAGNVVLFFVFWALYNLFRRRFQKIPKVLSLGTISALVVTVGFLISEGLLEIDSFDCDVEGGTAISMMFVSIFTIIYLIASTRKKAHLFNKKIDRVISIVFIILLTIVVLMIALDGDLSEVLSFIFALPISILLFFFD